MPEFAFEIGSGLLTEVRRLQSILGERDKAMSRSQEVRDLVVRAAHMMMTDPPPHPALRLQTAVLQIWVKCYGKMRFLMRKTSVCIYCLVCQVEWEYLGHPTQPIIIPWIQAKECSSPWSRSV
jgi:hypothetical protein